MPFTNCLVCEGVAKSTVIVEQFTSRRCGHVYCHRCGITHDTDIDEVSTADLTNEDVESIDDETRYRKLFVETSTVRDEQGRDYARFAWTDQHGLRHGVTEHAVDALNTHVDRDAPLRILDLGCGSGFTSIVLAEKFPHSTVYSVDPSPQVMQVDGHEGRIIAIRGTIRSAGLERESFDVVVILGNLMLHDDPFDTIERALACLRPGGLLLFDYKNVRSSMRLAGIALARCGVAKFLPHILFSRNFVNMRYGFHERYLDRFMSRQNVRSVGRRSKPPRLLEFANKSALASGWKGWLWRASDRIDRLRGEQAWVQLEYRKG